MPTLRRILGYVWLPDLKKIIALACPGQVAKSPAVPT
jgi:hypothetical protein